MSMHFILSLGIYSFRNVILYIIALMIFWGYKTVCCLFVLNLVSLVYRKEFFLLFGCVVVWQI